MSEIANSSLDTAVQENTTGVAPVISTPPSGPSIDTTASQAPIAPEDPEKPPVRPIDENSAAGKAGVNAKEDWFLTRVTAPISALKIF
jgi:hypothetical protein